MYGYSVFSPSAVRVKCEEDSHPRTPLPPMPGLECAASHAQPRRITFIFFLNSYLRPSFPDHPRRGHKPDVALVLVYLCKCMDMRTHRALQIFHLLTIL